MSITYNKTTTIKIKVYKQNKQHASLKRIVKITSKLINKIKNKSKLTNKIKIKSKSNHLHEYDMT